jgi:hypothetical protein
MELTGAPRFKGYHALFLSAFLGVCLLSNLLLIRGAIGAEGGSTFYLLGQRAFGAGVLPPEGVFFSAPNYYYSGDTSNSTELEFGGSLTVGADLDLFLTMPTALWVTPVDILGGDLALSGTFVLGNADVDANATLAIPDIGVAAASRKDQRWAVGDPVFGAVVGWHAENLDYLVATTVNVPIGDYDKGHLANVALHRWAADVTGAVTWLDPAISIGVSGAAGVTFNGENDRTDYQTGTEFHLEAAVGYYFTPAFSLGVSGYHYQQLTADSGKGATLGSFKGRVSALEPTAAATVMVGPVPVVASLSYYWEVQCEKPAGRECRLAPGDNPAVGAGSRNVGRSACPFFANQRKYTFHETRESSWWSVSCPEGEQSDP